VVRSRRVLAAVLAGLVAFGPAACDETPADPTPAPASAGGDLQGFVDCLASNGVTLPEPGMGNAAAGDDVTPQGVDPATWAAAQAACAGTLPAG